MSEKGSRIIPQNTWFYADSGLSCPQRTYENIALHYGTCSTAQVNNNDLEGETQCDGSGWLGKGEGYSK